MTVGISLPNPAVSAVYKELRSLIAGDSTSSFDRSLLGYMHRRRTLGTRALDCPPA
jgi:hypothetical protein